METPPSSSPVTSESESTVLSENAMESEAANPTNNVAQARERPRLRSRHLITPGVSQVIFQALKKEVQKISVRNRACVLLFNEIDVEPHLNYLSHEDYIIGFEDFGWTRTKNFADSATVFMLRSIFGSWKQPVAFAFHDWPMQPEITVRYFKAIARECKLVDLNLFAVVCSHASYNIQAIDALLGESKLQNPEKSGVIVVGEREIVPLFDPSTLLVSLRNNMLTRNVSFSKDGMKKVAMWSHIREAYEIDRDMGIEYLKKITEEHVDPDHVKKANVTHCAQTFSRTMATFLNMVAGKISDRFPKSLPIEASETADLVAFVDRIFDSVNGGVGQMPVDKPLRAVVTEKSPHLKAWVDGKAMFAQMDFLEDKPESKSNVFAGWCRTLEAFARLQKVLFDWGHVIFPARAFNLDPLENCFSLMGQLQPPGRVLTCKNFSVFYNTSLTVKDVSVHHSSDSNCENDELSFLVSTDDFEE